MRNLCSLIGVLAACGCAQLAAPSQPGTLAGTSWQLARFEGGDGAVRVPDDKSKYTLSFGADGGIYEFEPAR